MAATRYYPTIRPPGTALFAPPLGTWSSGQTTRDNRGDNHWTYLLDQSKTGGGAVASQAHPAQVGIGVEDVWSGQRWITPRLGAQTLGGTLTVTMMVAISGAAAAVWKIHAYLSVGDSLTQRAVLVSNVVDTSAWSNAFTFISVVLTLPAQGVTAGDRIVVELGARITGVSGEVATIRYGTTDSGGTPGTDGTNGDTTTTHVGWMEFSAGLTEQGGEHAAPPNTTCLTATTIAALPFGDGPTDTIGSSDTNKSVWYTYTPPSNQILLLSTWLGNYRPRIQIWRGSCAGLISVGTDQSFTDVWLGRSQSLLSFHATGGTQYWFQVESQNSQSTTQAINCGGALAFQVRAYSAPQTDDLFVDCQWIVSLREGVLVNGLGAFYNGTPTGSAIDYTLRPLVDQNGGTSTALRLYVTLFGSLGDVEILDLATLNVGQFEVDFLIDAITGANHGQNLASIVFDLAGNIYLGWFGDHYDVIGKLSTPSACAVRVIDGTHADDQPGSPYPIATALTVAQDVGGSDYVDIASDQRTLFYTSSGTAVKRFDAIGNAQLADYASVPNASGPRPGLRGGRLLPPGDGSGGMLVTNGSQVVRLNAAGAVVQTYTPALTARAQDLDKLELNHAATAFWVSDQLSTDLWKFDLATGTELLHVQTGLPAGQLCGFSIFNGYRAGLAPPPPPPPSLPAPCPIGLPPSASGPACASGILGGGS